MRYSKAEVDRLLTAEEPRLPSLKSFRFSVQQLPKARIRVDLRSIEDGVEQKTVDTVNDIAGLTPDHIATITTWLYEDARAAQATTAYYRRWEKPGGRSIFDRLLRRPTASQLEEIPIDSPDHPAQILDIRAIPAMLTDISLAIDENLPTTRRLVEMHFIVPWEEEHGRSIVIRDGAPVTLCDPFPALEDFDAA